MKRSIIMTKLSPMSINDISKSNSEMNSTMQNDALKAVKVDPAVLDVQVTVDAKSSDNSALPHQPNTLKTNSKDIREHSGNGFERALMLQRTALLSLSPDKLRLLMKYVETLRRQRNVLQKQMECAFCKNNGHPEVWYTTHALKDSKNRVRCPILRSYICPICGATGEHAHTPKYCPDKKIVFQNKH